MAVATLRTLTQAQVDQFMRDGFVVVEDLLDTQEITALGERADLIASGKAGHVVKGMVQRARDRIHRSGARTVVPLHKLQRSPSTV